MITSLVIFDDVADVVVPHGRFGNYNNEDLLERIRGFIQELALI